MFSEHSAKIVSKSVDTYLKQFVILNLFEVKSGESVVKVEFSIAELPNDMMMLCFLAGELNNNVYHFSTFTNVNRLDCSNITKNIGEGSKDWMTFSTVKQVADGKKLRRREKN